MTEIVFFVKHNNLRKVYYNVSGEFYAKRSCKLDKSLAAIYNVPNIHRFKSQYHLRAFTNENVVKRHFLVYST